MENNNMTAELAETKNKRYQNQYDEVNILFQHVSLPANHYGIKI